MVAVAADQVRDAVKSLSAHPRWKVLIEYLQTRERFAVAKLLGVTAGECEVIRRQGMALEARDLLAQLEKFTNDDRQDSQGEEGKHPPIA